MQEYYGNYSLIVELIFINIRYNLLFYGNYHKGKYEENSTTTHQSRRVAIEVFLNFHKSSW